MNHLMSKPVLLVVVSGRRGTAVRRHYFQTLIQGSYGYFKVQPLTVRYFYGEISPRVGLLIGLAVKEIHAD